MLDRHARLHPLETVDHQVRRQDPQYAAGLERLQAHRLHLRIVEADRAILVQPWVCRSGAPASGEMAVRAGSTHSEPRISEGDTITELISGRQRHSRVVSIMAFR